MRIIIKGRIDASTDDLDIDLTMRPDATILVDGNDVRALRRRVDDIEYALAAALDEIRQLQA
jgi:hypothetical protein